MPAEPSVAVGGLAMHGAGPGGGGRGEGTMGKRKAQLAPITSAAPKGGERDGEGR